MHFHQLYDFRVLPPKKIPYKWAAFPCLPALTLPSLWQTRIHFLFPQICLFWKFCVNGTLWDVGSCFWFCCGLHFTSVLLQVHLYCGMCHYFIPFYCGTRFLCMGAPYCARSTFISLRASGTFPCFSHVDSAALSVERSLYRDFLSFYYVQARQAKQWEYKKP